MSHAVQRLQEQFLLGLSLLGATLIVLALGLLSVLTSGRTRACVTYRAALAGARPSPSNALELQRQSFAALHLRVAQRVRWFE